MSPGNVGLGNDASTWIVEVITSVLETGVGTAGVINSRSDIGVCVEGVKPLVRGEKVADVVTGDEVEIVSEIFLSDEEITGIVEQSSGTVGGGL